MRKPEKVRNPSAARPTEQPSTAVNGSADYPGGVASVSTVQATTGRIVEAGFRFAQILNRDDGWLRCIPGADGKVNYFKWKFNSGAHSGKYVMFVGVADDWCSSIIGLSDKLSAVDDGLLKPAHDTFYDPR